MIIGCVDPFDIFGLVPGETAVIRNVGGRITPAILQTMAMLRIVAKASGGEIGPGWNLIVLHHTGCGINCLVYSPELLSKYFGVAPAELDAMAIIDPHKAVVVAALKANPLLPGGLLVTGLVYDVTPDGSWCALLWHWARFGLSRLPNRPRQAGRSNFPASTSRQATRAILSLMPLNHFVEEPVTRMRVVDDLD